MPAAESTGRHREPPFRQLISLTSRSWGVDLEGAVGLRSTRSLPILCRFSTVTRFSNDNLLFFPSCWFLTVYFILFISQQLHYLLTPPRPVRDECPASRCCFCVCCLATRGLEGRFFGCERAPCFCQACSLTQRFSRHVSSWNECRSLPDEDGTCFQEQTQHTLCYEDKWFIGGACHT